MSEQDRLDSWKEIAAHLGRDIRTARRWEQSEGLPVHRHVHKLRGTVYAYRSELDAWRASRRAEPEEPPPPAPQARGASGFVVAAVGCVAALGISIVLLARPENAVPPSAIPGRLLASITGEGQHPTVLAIGRALGQTVLSPDGRHLYVADEGDPAVHVIATATDRLLHTWRVPPTPVRLAIAPDGDQLYVATDQGDVLRFDTDGGARETLARGLKGLHDLVVTDDGRRLYVTAPFGGLRVIDTNSAEVREIPTVRCPVFLANVPQRDLLYVAYQCGGPGGRWGHDAIDVRRAGTGAALASISGPPHVGGVLVASPLGTQVWANGHDACLSPQYDHQGCPATPSGVLNVYRTDDSRHLAALPIDGDVGRLSFFADGSRVLAGAKEALSVVDTASLRVVEKADVGSSGGAVFTPDGRKAYLTLDGRGDLVIVDMAAGRCLPRPDDLSSWWPGDGHANDVAAESNGTLRNGAATAPAWIGQGFRFDGVDDRIDVTPLSGIETAQDFSIAAWAKPSADGRTEVLFDHGRAGQAGWTIARQPDGTIRFCFVGEGAMACDPKQSVASRRAVATGHWTHVVAVSSARGLSLFVDGKLDATTEAGGRPATFRQDLRIAAPFRIGTAFAGMLDEIQAFRKALSAEEVRALHGADRWGVCYR